MTDSPDWSRTDMSAAETETLASPAKPIKPLTQVKLLPHPDLCPQGIEFEARAGRKLVDALLEHGVAIEHACEKVGACATCHVHVRAGGDHLEPADDEEEDQLDAAWGLDGQSRLSCCIKVRGPALVIELPRYTKNHAREK